jgi:hypothetical protein
MHTKRPPFAQVWTHFKAIYGSGTVASVGTMIGGKVLANIQLGQKNPNVGFTNACAIRMSYSLNHAGVHITHGVWKTVTGADGRQYIFRVRDLLKFLTQRFGDPDRIVKNPTPESFTAMKGILVFAVDWADASGHATLWDGVTCSDHCYFPAASEASLWFLG